MRHLSRLRTLASRKNDEGPDHNSGRSSGSRDASPNSGNASSSGGGKLVAPIPPSKKTMRTTKRSLLQEHKSEDDERGCVEAVTAFLAAIARAHDAASKQGSSEGDPPALRQTSKGSGMIACRDSARQLLHVFGHAPLVHLEGVIWIKTSGQRGVLHGFKKAKKSISDRIVEIPLGSIVDVKVVSGREHLKTFRTEQANSVSRPFRIVTTKDPYDDGETAGPVAVASLTRGAFGVNQHHQVLLVGFEDVCRLQRFLVLACESWAVRAGDALGGPMKELLSCAPLAAQRYLTGVFEAMTGSLRSQVDAQVDLMEDLANELMLDTVVKEMFFSTGDIFFEIARRLEAAAAMAEVSTVEGEDHSFSRDMFDVDTRSLSRRYRQREVVTDARLISAAAAVLDAAFFHSLQSPQRVYLVGLPKPMCLPVVAENLVHVYCDLRRRILRHAGAAGRDDGARVPAQFAGKSAMTTWDDVLTGVQDRVVRALNEMSDVVSLFNIENEKRGLVRNLVGVGIGTRVRAGVQPEASDALALLVRVNDRTVGLIEDLDRREKERRRLEAERLLARGPAPVSPASERARGGRRSVFARLSCLSPGSRSRRSLTPPASSPASPSNQSAGGASAVRDNAGGGLQDMLLEGGAETGRAKIAAFRHLTEGESMAGSGGQPGRRGGPDPPPSAGHGVSRPPSPRSFLRSLPALLHSYAKLLNALVCGSYNLRAAYVSSCEADLRNIGREGGYLDMLAELDGGAPRMVFRQTALFLQEILVECHL